MQQLTMRYLVRVWDLVTSDPLALLVGATLAVTLLALFAMTSWAPRRTAAPRSRSEGRSSRARALMASGTEMTEVARRTGLSRDAIALVSGEHRATPATPAARQKGPKAARLSLPWRRPQGVAPIETSAQVTV